jgi:glycosyltransferase involved in cell wall biosynthesis
VVRVSVIIPCYNRERLLGETLDSLRGQTYSDWEAIVVDDNSQDNSVEVGHRYGRLDSRIHAVSRQGDRKGGNICRNQGLALAQGEYIVFLDSDDLLSPFCLQHRVAAMDNASHYGFGVYQTELGSGIKPKPWVCAATDNISKDV